MCVERMDNICDVLLVVLVKRDDLLDAKSRVFRLNYEL